MNTVQIILTGWAVIAFLALILLAWSYARHRREEQRLDTSPFMQLSRQGEWFCFLCLGCGTSWFWPAMDKLAAHPGIVREVREHQCLGQ